MLGQEMLEKYHRLKNFERLKLTLHMINENFPDISQDA